MSKHYPVYYKRQFVGTTGEGRDQIFNAIVQLKQQPAVRKKYGILSFLIGIVLLLLLISQL